MKKLLLLPAILLAFLLAAQSTPAQSDDSRVPLYLFTSGAGKILPFHDGQMLDVGRKYQLIAVAAPGYRFAGWSPVYVAIIVMTETNDGGVFYETNTVASVQPISSTSFLLNFTMQPEILIVDTPLLRISEIFGWQADFVTSRRRFKVE